MKTITPLLIHTAAFCCVTAHAGEPQSSPESIAPVVFFDIAGPQDALLAAFYASIFGWDVKPDGKFEAPVIGARLPAAIRTDPAEKVIYVGVADIKATLAKIAKNGGSVVAPRFEVPGVVVLGLFLDPAGNRLGLVEMKNGKAVVP